MPIAWTWVSEFGNSKWLLPAVALLIVVSIRSGTLPLRAALRWALAIAVTAGIALASKLAFMGWGIGSAALDFTGFSGHAAMSSCIYPPLLVLLGYGRRWPAGLLASLGLAIALLIAWSRLPLHAHSVSEVVAGLVLGSSASAFTLAGWTRSSRTLQWLRWLAPATLAIATLQISAPSVSTHRLVIATAKTLSGRDHVYTRKWLHTRSVNTTPVNVTQAVAQAVDTVGFSRQPEGAAPSPYGFQESP